MNKTSAISVIALGTLSVAVVLGVMVFGVDENSTPFITTVLGMLGLALNQIRSNHQADATRETVTELNKDLRNGTFERLVREALEKIANDPDTKLEITKERREDDGRGSNL